MTNLQVIQRFIKKEEGRTPARTIHNHSGYYTTKGNTLTSTRKILINYNTPIAYWENDTIIVNVRKYSSTTSHIQAALIREIEKHGINYIRYGVNEHDR